MTLAGQGLTVNRLIQVPRGCPLFCLLSLASAKAHPDCYAGMSPWSEHIGNGTIKIVLHHGSPVV